MIFPANIFLICRSLQGFFPPVPKVAKVVPVHKKGSKLDFSNYRSISFLSNLDKILEALALAFLSSITKITLSNLYNLVLDKHYFITFAVQIIL